MNSLLARTTLFLLAMAWSFAGLAQQATLDGDLVVENAWTRATVTDNRTAAIYLTLRNVSRKTVDLIGVRTDRASIETLHKTATDSKGANRMSAAPELKIKAGETVVLEPGGLHVMLIDVETPLIKGETLPLRLKFYDGDDITVDVPILGDDASGPKQ